MFHCHDLEKQKEIMKPNPFSIPYACISIIIGFIINIFIFVYSNFTFVVCLNFYI